MRAWHPIVLRGDNTKKVLAATFAAEFATVTIVGVTLLPDVAQAAEKKDEKKDKKKKDEAKK